MSLLRRAAKFVVQELVRAAATQGGTHVGDAIGKRIARRIYPTAENKRDDGTVEKPITDAPAVEVKPCAT